MGVLLSDFAFPSEDLDRVFTELAFVEELQRHGLVTSSLPDCRDDQAERAFAQDADVLEALGEEALLGSGLEHLLSEELLELVGAGVVRHCSIFARVAASIINHERQRSSFGSPQFDLSTATFSQDGRIFQLEYAQKVLENSE